MQSNLVRVVREGVPVDVILGTATVVKSGGMHHGGLQEICQRAVILVLGMSSRNPTDILAEVMGARAVS